MRNKQVKTVGFKASVNDEGYLEAVFSVFNIIDSDGDVVLPSAIADGKEIALVWSHNWSMPVGKGTIYNDGSKAIFKGNFFTDTTWGKDAYNTVKNMGDLQEYSWGFKVEHQYKGEKDGKAVNFIEKTEEFEVSPVLIGANRQTETILVKSFSKPSVDAGTEKKTYIDATADGSYEELQQQLNAAFRDRQFDGDAYAGYTCIVATYTDHFVAELWKWTDEEESFWDVPYARQENGKILLGDPVQVEASMEFVPVQISPTVTQSMNYDSHSDYVRIAVTGLLRRSKSGLDLRRKEGRAISTARRSSLETVVTWLNDAAKEVQGLLDDTAPSSDEDTVDNDKGIEDAAREVYAQFLRTESKILGVA